MRDVIWKYRSSLTGRHRRFVETSDGVTAAIYGVGALARVAFIRGRSTSCGPWAEWGGVFARPDLCRRVS